MSLDRIRIGFIPLVDAAVPIVAADLGFAAAEGIEVELAREISWSNVRDRLALGHYEAAHLLAPLAIATSLGLNSVRAQLSAPVTLGLNGNAITLAPHFDDELAKYREPAANFREPRESAAAFARLVAARRANGDEPPVLGMTFPFSTHNYQLRLWLAAAGLTPDQDVRLAVVPPPFMVDALEQGHVEGFCVGAPWNSVAVDLGIGRIRHLGVDLVGRCPEKVLAVRTGWLAGNGELAARLVRACVAAADWLDHAANHAEAAELLARRDRLDAPAHVIRRTFDGVLPTGRGEETFGSDRYMIFGREGALRPDPRHARWLFGEMARWGQTPAGSEEAAAAVYRPDVFDAATGTTSPEAPEDPLGLVLK